MKRYVMEFLGTFFLALAVCVTGNPFAIGLMFMTMVYIGMHVSGGHFNPAVSLAFWMQRKLETKFLLGYILAQTLGATLAVYMFMNLTKNTFAFVLADGISFFQATYIEAILTFLLCMVMLTVVVSKKLKGNYIYGLAIGLCLTAISFIGGPITGGVVNPALGVGMMLPEAYQSGSTGCVLVYLIGPFLGGILASYGYGYFNSK